MKDKQLQSCRHSHEEIADRLKQNLPVTLKEMAIGLDVSYSLMLDEAKAPGFPMWHGLVFPEDFVLYRRQKFADQAVFQEFMSIMLSKYSPNV